MAQSDLAKADLILMHHTYALQLMHSISSLGTLLTSLGHRALAQAAADKGWAEGAQP